VICQCGRQFAYALVCTGLIGDWSHSLARDPVRLLSFPLTLLRWAASPASRVMRGLSPAVRGNVRKVHPATLLVEEW